MDIDWMRSMITVIAFLTFIGIVAWAWSARKRKDFDRAAHSILVDDEDTQYQSTNITAKQGRPQ